jgi:hypothetical protein
LLPATFKDSGGDLTLKNTSKEKNLQKSLVGIVAHGIALLERSGTSPTEEEIENAQRRYRTRQIKQFLRNYKKNEQNAIVIKLNEDLKDLSIGPEAMFEFINLEH